MRLESSMEEDFTQPFYVPIGRGKRNLHTGQRGGYYLPALEPKPFSPSSIVKPPEPQWTRRQWDTVGQLRGQIKYLETKLYEHLDKAKKGKGDYV